MKSPNEQVREWLDAADRDDLMRLIDYLAEVSIEAAVLTYQFVGREPAPRPNPHRTRYWTTPQGVRVTLAWLDHTSRNLGRPGLRDGGTADGWCLTVKHPDSGVVLNTSYLGAQVPEEELASALEAIGAVPALGRWHLDGPDDPEEADIDADRDETGRQERREELYGPDDPDPRV